MNTTKITAEMNAAIASVIADGKTPWVCVKDGAVVEVYVSRANARSAKDGGKIMKAEDAGYKAPTGNCIVDGTMPNSWLNGLLGVAPVAPAVNKTALPVIGALADFIAEPSAAAPVAKPKATKIPVLRASEIERPCKRVLHIADEMMHAAGGLEKLRRKDVLARCVAEKIAYYTARTQYQLWLTIQNGGSI